MECNKEQSLRISLFKSLGPTSSNIKICVSPSSTAGDDSIFRYSMQQQLPHSKPSQWKLFPKYLRIFVLTLSWVWCSYSLMMNHETVQDVHQISIQKGAINSYVIYKKPDTKQVSITVEGAILPAYYGNLSHNYLSVWIQLLVVKKKPRSTSDIKSSDVICMQNVSSVWVVPLVTERLIGVVPEVASKKTFELDLRNADNSSFTFLRFQFKSNLKTNLPILMGYNLEPISPDDGIIYAALVLTGLYVLIIFEVIHRTLAAMLASTISIAILAGLNARPSLHEIVSWMDVETLLLLFSMMILVTIISETGIFDYLAIWTFKKTLGKIWPLICALCLTVTVLACFLDNVTTALLITPVTIKLCEVMKINPVPILTITVIIGNIGGAITPIGDPPNVIIASNAEVVRSGINFGIFTMHMAIGIFMALGVAFGLLKIIYRNPTSFKFPEPLEIQDLKQEIAVLQRTAASVSSYSKEEYAVKDNLLKETVKLQDMLQTTKKTFSQLHTSYDGVRNLEHQNRIKDKVLLFKSSITLFIVIAALFLHSVPSMNSLGMGWTSLLGAILLLVLYDDEKIEGIFARVEWSTLLFFASLFILMEALSKLGLIEFVGRHTEQFVMAVNPEARLTVAIILMLWVSAIASAFVDNLPLTTMMIRVATNLAANAELNLPLQPLVWALSFGACLGGNGSLLGSSSNIICAGMAEQHGYKFSFLEFLRVGLPVTLCTITVVNIYLIICHVVFAWH